MHEMSVSTEELQPRVNDVVAALAKVRLKGLPLVIDTTPDILLELPIVLSRSGTGTSREVHIKNLETILRQQLEGFEIPELLEASRILFGTGAPPRRLLKERRAEAAKLLRRKNGEEFRKNVEPKIMRQLGWQLVRESISVENRKYAHSGSIARHYPAGDDYSWRTDFRRSCLISSAFALHADLLGRGAMRARIEEYKEWRASRRANEADIAHLERRLEDFEVNIRYNTCKTVLLLGKHCSHANVDRFRRIRR